MSNYNNGGGGDRPVFTPRKKMYLNDWRMPHPASDAPMEGGKYPAQFMWELTNAGKVVLKISDGVYKEGAKSPHKEVELDMYHRNILFEALLEATNNPEFGTKQLVVKKHQFVRTGGASRMSDAPITQITLTIIRDADGIITLGYSKGDYKVKTRFKGPNQSVILVRNAGGETVEDLGVMSRMYVRSWIKFHQPVLDRMELEGYEPPKPREGTGGGAVVQRPSNQNQSNLNDGTFDDDIDF